MSGGHHGFCRVASPYSRTIYLLLTLVRSFEERTLTKEIEPPGKAALSSLPLSLGEGRGEVITLASGVA